MLRTSAVALSLALLAIALPAFAKKNAPATPDADPSGPVFDKSAAVSALSSVSLLPCKQTNGPTGDGHVLVTFAPTGEAQSANVDRDPFKNTAVGRCIAGQYKHVHVPKFAGTAVTVGKTFHVD